MVQACEGGGGGGGGFRSLISFYEGLMRNCRKCVEKANHLSGGMTGSLTETQ